MNEHSFSIIEALKEGWRLTKKHIGFLISFQIIIYALMFLFRGSSNSLGSIFWQVLGSFVIMITWMGFYNSALLITSEVKPGFDQLYQNWRKLITWILTHFIFGILFFLGLILFIVPGCYVLGKYGLYPFFILDKNVGTLEALTLAGKTSQENRWHIFLLFLVCTGINLLGLLCFGVGLLITSPITLLALTTVYRQLTNENPLKTS